MPVEPPPSPWGFPRPAAWPAAPTTWSAMGADLAPGTLLAAYRRALPDARRAGRRDPIGWFSPVERGRAAARRAAGLALAAPVGRGRFEVRVDTAFADVVDACADPRRPGGWIDADVRGGVHRAARARLGALGRDLARRPAGRWAVRRRDRRPVRGRVDVPPRARRVEGGAGRAGRAARGRARRERLLDVQWVTPHLASLGVVAIPREEYLARLRGARDPAGRPACPASSATVRARSLQQPAHPAVGQGLAAGLAGRAVLQAGVGEADTSRTVSPQTGHVSPVRPCTARWDFFSPFSSLIASPRERSTASPSTVRIASYRVCTRRRSGRGRA